ncbi:unnamed protein product [Cyprideis torosa]|uniref:Receptor expression-enhancing protein n=1 Tax=Cyprideis torosa TaxID=163714 RepID=A0A7R8ZNC3_9CRUS|nr:unnamed protein product [Cyprideis torosa]CAG0887548.1 unnamed protein product [Cyprideis torosa]
MHPTIQHYLDQLDKVLHQKNAVTDALATVEKKTGVQRRYLAAGLISFIALYLVYGYGAELVCNSIGFVYPAYTSIKAIESRNKDDDTKWLTYWVVFAVFSLLEFFADILVGWFPFYWLTKCIFLVWCFAPISSNGSQILYNRVIRPYFLKHQVKVDEALDRASSKAKAFASRAGEEFLRSDD